MSKQVIIAVAVVATLAVGVAAYAISHTRPVAMVHEAMTEGDSIHTDKESTTTTADQSSTDVPKTPGTYSAYSADRLADAKTGKVVIFFAASWCPDCRALDANITAHLAMIPTGFTILKADYDQELKLKQKYGVTYQHTLVRVDQDGQLIKKWSGSFTLTELLGQAG